MAQPTLYNIPPNANGVNGFALKQAGLLYSATLAANTAATVTVPSSFAMGTYASPQSKPQFVAVFSYEAGPNVYVSINNTAAVPAGATLAATTSELNPHSRLVQAGDVISVITATASTDITIALYAINN